MFSLKVYRLCVKGKQAGLCSDFGVRDFICVLCIACVGVSREIDLDFTCEM